MFKLTKDEQKVIAFVLGVFILGLAVRYWRSSREKSEPLSEKVTAKEQQPEKK